MLLLAVLFVAACGTSTEHTTATVDPADFTVLSKVLSSERGPVVVVRFAGADREVTTHLRCWEEARLGAVLPERVTFVEREPVPATPAAEWTPNFGFDQDFRDVERTVECR